MATRFGRQPAKDELYQQRWSIVRAAKEIGVTPAHLKQALLGIITPSPVVRQRLPELLNCSIEDLFTEESRTRPFFYTGKWPK